MSGCRDVIYIHELSEKLGLSPEAIWSHIRRDSDAVPPPFKLGRKYAWRLADVDAWLQAKVEASRRD